METTTMILATLLATTIILQGSIISAATTAHVVGGSSTGWTFPPNTTFYSDWASSQTIASGDTLVFNFPTGQHTVVEVPKSSYDACSTTKQIGSTINNGPATVTVTSGTHYYICGVPGHCNAGMKLVVTVTSAAVATAPSTPPATTKPSPPASSPVATPTSVVAPSVGNPPPTSALVARPTTASSLAPAAAKKPAASPPAGSIPTGPSSTTITPTAPEPSRSSNVPSSSSALRGATGTLVALLSIVVAFWLV